MGETEFVGGQNLQAKRAGLRYDTQISVSPNPFREAVLLSYRHSFHAGNFADLIKHIVLVEILEHLIKKDKPFHYIDTHSGAGLFDLAAPHAQKLAEHAGGISQLKAEDWPELAAYFKVLNFYNGDSAREFYPGSPLIALRYLRDKDHAWLFELHPSDLTLLQQNTAGYRRVKVTGADGLKGLLGLVPPVTRRGLALIDPSYELKSDYTQVVETLIKAHRKFATGIYALWYPVVERGRISALQAALKTSGIRDIQCYEIGLSPDSDAKGMTATGMIVINPPWGLFDKMATLLPKLVRTLSEDAGAFHRCDILVPE